METVVEEIARQLGLAVDKAGEFIVDMLPQFAGMKATQGVMVSVIAFLVVAVCLVVACKIYRAKDEQFGLTYEQECSVTACVFISVIATFIGVFFLWQAVKWGAFPEAALIEFALSRIGA